MIEPLESRTLLTIQTPQLLGIAATLPASTGLPNATPVALTVHPSKAVAQDSASTDPSNSPTVVVTVAELTSNQDPSTVNVTVADTGGNSYNLGAQAFNGTSSGVGTLVFSAPVTTALSLSSTITVSFTGSKADPGFSAAVNVFEVDGVATTAALDAKVTNTGTGTTASANLTTSNGADIVLGAVGVNPAAPITSAAFSSTNPAPFSYQQSSPTPPTNGAVTGRAPRDRHDSRGHERRQDGRYVQPGRDLVARGPEPLGRRHGRVQGRASRSPRTSRA